MQLNGQHEHGDSDQRRQADELCTFIPSVH